MHIKVSEASDALRLLFQNKKQVFFHTCAANNDLRLLCSGAWEKLRMTFWGQGKKDVRALVQMRTGLKAKSEGLILKGKVCSEAAFLQQRL